MKRLLILISLLSISSMAFAQVRGGLQGPAAKNYKYWLDDNKPVATKVVTSDQETVLGPTAKNQTWHRQSEEADKAETYNTVATVTDRPRLMGPKAKNSKPWKNFQYANADLPKDPVDPRVLNE